MESNVLPVWGSFYRDSTTNEVVRYVPLHSGQQAVMDSTARFIFFICGKGSGKSTLGPIWLEREIRKYPLGSFIIASDTYNRLEQGLLPEFFKAMSHSDLKGEWKQGKHVYNLSTGGKVYVRSLDDPESINGLHCSAAVIDEGLLLSRGAWDIVESRTHVKKARVLVTSTPYRGKRWGLEIIERAKIDPKNYYVFQGGSVLNPAVSKEEIERQKKCLPKWKFDQDYLGLFSQPEGVVYPNFRACVISADKLPQDAIHHGRILGGMDFGHGAAPSSAVVGILHNDILYLIYELYQRPNGQQSSYLDFAKTLKTWHNQFYQKTGRTVERFYCDSATDTWKALKRYRLDGNDISPSLNCRPAKKGSGSVEFGIDLVTARLQLGKLKIIEGLAKDILEEADQYRYDVSEDNPNSSVLVGPCHSLDAIRYLIMSLKR